MNRAELKQRRTRARDVRLNGSKFQQLVFEVAQPIVDMSLSELQKLEPQIREAVEDLYLAVEQRGANECINLATQQLSDDESDTASLLIAPQLQSGEIILVGGDTTLTFPKSVAVWEHVLMTLRDPLYRQMGDLSHTLPDERQELAERREAMMAALEPESIALLNRTGLQIKPSLSQKIFLQKNRLAVRQQFLRILYSSQQELASTPVRKFTSEENDESAVTLNTASDMR